MRRKAALIVVVLVFVWVVGCSHFINQSQNEFFSVEKGPNREAFDVPVENEAPPTKEPSGPALNGPALK